MNILSITSQTWIITLVGYFVVFLVLVTLIFIFGWLMPLILKKMKKKPKKKMVQSASGEATESTDCSDEDITAGESAAIAMALHLFLNSQHDEESNVITIKNIKRRYSPWNSKIHSMNNTLDRR
ncbi:OadG family protein [Halosquirtibacter xylanolyticus]|uniref:OadG family protein n=1 Tax=Halosquirtibacter xylanolyticus TaxID=3374599 RepID=UPI0037491C05|nr:OadG family protein [Prolixibacteraceae bacterium]